MKGPCARATERWRISKRGSSAKRALVGGGQGSKIVNVRSAQKATELLRRREMTRGAISRREQVQQHLWVQKLVARGREHDRLWSTSRVWPQGPLGCPKPRWHRLCARRDSAASSGKWSVRPSAQRYSIVRLPPSLQPDLAQPPNESVGRLALRRGGVAALRPNVASPMSPLMPQLSAKSYRYAGSIP